MAERTTLKLRHPEPEVRAAQDAAVFSPEKARFYAALLKRCNVDDGANVADPANWKSAPAYGRWSALCDALDGNLARLDEIPRHLWDSSTDLAIDRTPGCWVIYRRLPRGYARGSGSRRMPCFRHESFASAEAEAVRLASENPAAIFVIMQEVATVQKGGSDAIA